MASFNLGRIKGEKGDKGDTGAIGERGPQGERGETGARGQDGKTPVFTIGETVTLPSNEEAYVELDSSDIENPVLSFHIPRGSDGRDANGDMEKIIYDSEGKREDFYKYADALFEKALKKEGDTVTGALKANGAESFEAVMRNISVQTTLPEVATEGDICILTPSESAKKLGDCEVGSVMIIEEASNQREYVIVAKNRYVANSVTLMRKSPVTRSTLFNYAGRKEYSLSNMDMMLELGFVNKFPKAVQNNLLCADLELSDTRRCFLLAKEDFEQFEYLQVPEHRISTDQYFTRSTTGDKVYVVDTSGNMREVLQTEYMKYRPSIILPQTLEVENDIYNSNPVVKIAEKRYGLYMFVEGAWKECASL